MAFLIPLAILSIYFHIQFNLNLKETGKAQLIILAENQRNTIDLFLQERVVNILSLFRRGDLNLSPSSDDMRNYLQSLREMSDAFVDVGFLDETGLQKGYSGPFSFLQGKDYSHEEWFQSVMRRDQNYYISDIYLGFRRKPHFTIAVKQMYSEKLYIIRATLNPDKFHLFLRTIGQGKGAESYLINKEGKYQVVDPDRGQLLGSSAYVPSGKASSGANEISEGGKSEIVAYAWLDEAPWALIVRQPLDVAYATMYSARRVLIMATAVIVLALIVLIIAITDRLLNRAQMMEESRKELRSQLIHASKLVSVGELAGGVAHEINNPLSIISVECGLIKDMLDPRFGLEYSPEKIRAELDHINKAVFRARDITQKLLRVVRKTEPMLTKCNINQLIGDVLDGVKEKEFEVSNIKLVRDLDEKLPELTLDPDQIQQVFLNIINNAGDAINGAGTITIATRHDEDSVRVTITDTGKGMTSEQLTKIFHPFYTTKELGKGTGLGLSISLSIVEAFGGRIEVQSAPGAGSSFTVVLPRKHQTL